MGVKNESSLQTLEDICLLPYACYKHNINYSFVKKSELIDYNKLKIIFKNDEFIIVELTEWQASLFSEFKYKELSDKYREDEEFARPCFIMVNNPTKLFYFNVDYLTRRVSDFFNCPAPQPYGRHNRVFKKETV